MLYGNLFTKTSLPGHGNESITSSHYQPGNLVENLTTYPLNETQRFRGGKNFQIGKNYHEAQDYFHHFFCFMAVYSILLTILGIIFVKDDVNDDEKKKGTNNVTEQEQKETMATTEEEMEKNKQLETELKQRKNTDQVDLELSEIEFRNHLHDHGALKGWVLFTNVEFHLIVWPLILLGGVNVTLTYNLTSMTRSYGLEHHATLMLSILFVSWVLTRIPVFVFIDRVPNKSIFEALSALSLTMCLLMLTFIGDNIASFITAIILSGFANASTWTSGPALLTKFSMKYFGYNYGWVSFGYGVLGLGLQALTGYFYDINIDISVTHTCYGLHCFSRVLLISAGLCLLSLVLSVIHIIKFT